MHVSFTTTPMITERTTQSSSRIRLKSITVPPAILRTTIQKNCVPTDRPSVSFAD
jgi:hypothetical protein